MIVRATVDMVVVEVMGPVRIWRNSGQVLARSELKSFKQFTMT